MNSPRRTRNGRGAAEGCVAVTKMGRLHTTEIPRCKPPAERRCGPGDRGKEIQLSDQLPFQSAAAPIGPSALPTSFALLLAVLLSGVPGGPRRWLRCSWGPVPFGRAKAGWNGVEESRGPTSEEFSCSDGILRLRSARFTSSAPLRMTLTRLGGLSSRAKMWVMLRIGPEPSIGNVTPLSRGNPNIVICPVVVPRGKNRPP